MSKTFAQYLLEKWDAKNVINPKKKGMFKGKSKEEIKANLEKLKATKNKTPALKTKEHEDIFALRAKNKFGKVEEGKGLYRGARKNKEKQKELSEEPSRKTTHKNPLVSIHNHKGELIGHMNFSVAHDIHGLRPNDEGQAVHSAHKQHPGGAAEYFTRDNKRLYLSLSKHHHKEINEGKGLYRGERKNKEKRKELNEEPGTPYDWKKYHDNQFEHHFGEHVHHMHQSEDHENMARVAHKEGRIEDARKHELAATRHMRHAEYHGEKADFHETRSGRDD